MIRTRRHDGPALDATVSFEHLVRSARRLAEHGARRVLGITGTPGAGKSTLCNALVAELGDSAMLVAMDGFHLANRELTRLGRKDRKGAPDTFDVEGYLARLCNQTEPVVYAPLFDRRIEESIAGSVPVAVDTPLVITEGNYLLLQAHGWSSVRERLDEVWFLDTDPHERTRRLNARRPSHGHPEAAAATWVRDVDEPNALLVEAGRQAADLVAHLATTIPDSNHLAEIRTNENMEARA